MKDYLSLENFWKRYNKVLLDKLSLDKQKQMLTTENAQLRVLIKQYLDGISVNSDVLANPNPLLIVNNRTNARLVIRNFDYFLFCLQKWVKLSEIEFYFANQIYWRL